MSDTDPRIAVLSQANVEHVPGPADVTTVLVTLPPGSAGSPPHRHPGPVFGYLISGEIASRSRVNPSASSARGRRSGSRAATSSTTRTRTTSTRPETVFTVTAVLPPGADLLVPVSDEELAERAHLRAPRSN
ncbi:hypothetical protein [Dermacoccus abyssi]|uniref:hypothetical protein n=1 Tax=Dermacoccus abyssi TaxID=322596 RepID=UPI001F4DE69B|nr:hypothetical protein [Dermacoccus abyssi]